MEGASQGSGGGVSIGLQGRVSLTFDDVSSCSGDEACSQQVEVGASVHLALGGLQPADLSFRLPVGPRRAKSCRDRMLVGVETRGKRSEKAAGDAFRRSIDLASPTAARRRKGSIRRP